MLLDCRAGGYVFLVGAGRRSVLRQRRTPTVDVHLTGKLKKFAMVALATAGVIVGTSCGTASAINTVPCGNSEFASLDYRMSPDAVGNEYLVCSRTPARPTFST
jgi:hypothetical protein